MPTSYPKSTPTETLGLLVLLNQHKGSEEIARMADDLDLEIDEILPSLEFTQVLGLVKVGDGRATFTDLGRKFIAGSILERKALLRDQLRRTTLFKTLLRAIENSPERSLTDEDVGQILAFTPAEADEAIQNIVNWGRYTELVRYDSDDRRWRPGRQISAAKSTGGSSSRRPPPTMGSGITGSRETARTTDPSSERSEVRSVARGVA